jgi:adenine deaminase
MMMIEGRIVDVLHREIFEGRVHIEHEKIIKIERCATDNKQYILPGFIDAHVHMESSMLLPQRFGQYVIQEGTMAIVTDPHEIANVAGEEGIRYMKEDSKMSPIKTYFSIPSCVPATPFDASGSVISAEDVARMVASGEFVALSEMMDVNGVLDKSEEVVNKIRVCLEAGIPVDGHSPGLGGEDLRQYVAAGITTDHECFTAEEGREKIALGMKVLIREGSAARNYEALKPLIASHTDEVMFCTDDSHPHELIEKGHISKMVRKAIMDGFDLFDVLQVASSNPIAHYKLDVGQLQEGDKADFIVVDDLVSFKVQAVYVEGEQRFDRERPWVDDLNDQEISWINHFNHEPITLSELKKPVDKGTKAIAVINGELITDIIEIKLDAPTPNLESDLKHDVIKMVYINRYENGAPQVAYTTGFGLKEGAIATTISHDSHNIIAAGCSDEEIMLAINAIIKQKGGLAISRKNEVNILPLPIAGLISDQPIDTVAKKYEELTLQIQEMGCVLDAPFMTLSFMSLIVIPAIKIGEKGLFSSEDISWIK